MEPLHLLAVGRLVEKKGFAVLLAALALLEIPFTLRIIGEGPERAGLQAMIDACGLQDRVSLYGPMTHAQLPTEYAAAHVVVAPSILDRSGDRDGGGVLPQTDRTGPRGSSSCVRRLRARLGW